MKYRSRTLESFFLTSSGQMPVLLVTGPRQIGKTTILKHLAENERVYVTLDEPLLRELASSDPALFLQRFPPPILIDEIQYAPQLLPLIKIMVDQDRRPGQFWLTGSQQFHLMRGVSESLAGRVGVINLLGFSRGELLGLPATPPFLPTAAELRARDGRPPLVMGDLFQRIWLGSFPALHQDPAPGRDLFYSSYIQTYLQRDIRDLANVGNEGAFLRFLRACAARTGQLLNLTDLCRDADISHPTAKVWLSILVSSGIAHLLEPFHSNFTKRLVKTPKLYLLDTGLAAYLTEWSSPQTLEAGAMNGAFLETWVVTEILKSYWHNGRRAPLFYYRDRDQVEIDLLIHQDNILYPIEIKKTAHPTAAAVRTFKTLEKLAGSGLTVGPGALLCLTGIRLPLNAEVQAVPFAAL
jgi:predicted AAA+ superfamily ATPase